MEILQSISLDFGKDTEPIVVFAKQGDIETRYIEIMPLNNGQKYILESGIVARLHITKPDGKIVLSDAVVDYEAGTIKAELTKQALAAAGIAVAEIGLYKDEALLTSQLFGIRVSKKACSDDAVLSSDDYKSLVDALAKAESAMKLAGEAADSANAAAKKAEKWGNVTATAKTLASGSEAAVKLTDAEGGKSFEFGIPRGENGLINGVRLNGVEAPPDENKVVDIEAYNSTNKPEVGGRNLLTKLDYIYEGDTYYGLKYANFEAPPQDTPYDIDAYIYIYITDFR